MTAAEMVTVARLADHYEKHVSQGHDPLEVATHDFNKFKREAPELWRFLRESERSDREIGDWLAAFFARKIRSGMSLKNFAADEFEQIAAGQGSKRQHATKKSPAQLQREIDEALARPPENVSAFQQAKVESAAVEREMSEAEQALNAITADVAQRHGVPERGPTGLTPDIVKAAPEWRAAKTRVDKAFARLRSFNATFVKRFAKELRAERSERTRERESRSGR